MTDISKRLAEIRERDDLVHDLYGNGWDDRATDAEMDRAVLLAAIEKVHEWATSDVVTAQTLFGDGYREAMRDIRDLLAAALSDTRGGESDG